MSETSKLFDEHYFATGCGTPYGQSDEWLGLFDGIAERIVRSINPAIVLDAGCAMGFLVESLRKRGVKAWGVDVSDYAIAHVREAAKPYCALGSVTQPFGRRYDLIVCIEVLEHLAPQDGEIAVANFCKHADDILFSSSPFDQSEPTHFNTRPREYWAELFAQNGFLRDVDFDASFVTAWAMRFRKQSEPLPRVARNYERVWWAARDENTQLRDALNKERANVAQAMSDADRARALAEAAQREVDQERETVVKLNATIEAEREHEAELRAELAAARDETAAARDETAAVRDELARADADRAYLRDLVHRIEQGRVMRLMNWFNRSRSDSPAPVAAATAMAVAVAPERTPAPVVAITPDEPASPEVAAPIASRSEEIAPKVAEPNEALSPETPPSPPAVHVWPPEYPDWMRQNEPDSATLEAQREEARALTRQPSFSFIVPVFNPPPDVLRDMLESVRAQTYEHWEVCLADGASNADVQAVLSDFERLDSRMKVARLDSNGGISANSNAALGLATGEFVALLDHDDTITPNYLFEVARLIADKPDADIVYFDEDKLSADGTVRKDPMFKPHVWAPETMLSANTLMHAVVRRSLVDEAGGFDSATDSAQDWDLMLRCAERARGIYHVPKVLYHWRMLPTSAAIGVELKPDAVGLQPRVVAAHLRRSGIEDASAKLCSPSKFQPIWRGDGRKVSVVIVSKDNAALLRACVDSVLTQTAYPNFDVVVVDTGSREPAALSLLEELQLDGRVRLLKREGPFNYSAANNFGAANCDGELLLFLNDDTQALEPSWMDEMARWAARPAIGAVGAKLLYPDGHIQHAGIVLGLGHIFNDASDGFWSSLFGSADWYRNVSAVTGACLMVRRDVFESVGGFDERFELAFADIDLCLRLLDGGYRNLYTPYARLRHHEGASRANFVPQHDHDMAARLIGPRVAAGDPYFNPNLSLASKLPALRVNP